jgi:hypothetical protein
MSKSARASASLVSSTAPTSPRPALFTSTSMPPNRATRRLGRGVGLRLVGHVERQHQQVPYLADGLLDGPRIASGRNDRVTAIERAAFTISRPSPRDAPVTNRTDTISP